MARDSVKLSPLRRITVIGVGRIGLAITAKLVLAGHSVTASDVRAEVAADVEAIGARWAPNSRSAVKDADVLMTVLPGSPELAQLMLGSANGGLLDALTPSTTWIDLTSASPALATDLNRAARQRGIHYLDAPIGGGPDTAEAAALTFYVGGDARVFDRCRSLFSALGPPNRTHHVGGAGSGYLVKLLINSLWFTQVVSLAEAALLAQAGGIHAETLDAILAASPAASAVIREYLPRLRQGDYVTNFGLDRVVEELTSLDDFAERQEVPFDLARETARLHHAALSIFGAVDGELLGAAYLEQQAGRWLSQ